MTRIKKCFTCEKCPTCGKNASIKESIEVKNESQTEIKFFKKMETVLKSHKSPYEKKIALFKCIKEIEVGEMKPIEKERINYLLQSKLHGELAKQSLKQYEKLTVEDFSKEK